MIYKQKNVVFLSFCRLKNSHYLCVKNQRNAYKVFQYHSF